MLRTFFTKCSDRLTNFCICNDKVEFKFKALHGATKLIRTSQYFFIPSFFLSEKARQLLQNRAQKLLDPIPDSDFFDKVTSFISYFFLTLQTIMPHHFRNNIITNFRFWMPSSFKINMHYTIFYWILTTILHTNAEKTSKYIVDLTNNINVLFLPWPG